MPADKIDVARLARELLDVLERVPATREQRDAQHRLESALAAPELAEPQEQVWLSVESAPMSYRGEYPCYVLLWNGHHVGVGFCADSEDDEVSTRYYDESTEIIVPPPTHWMPLPAPPIAAGRASKEKEPAK